MPSYGALNRAKVIGLDATTGGYYLEIVSLAAGRRWGPVPSMVPGLAVGDRVVVGQMGTSRDDVLIVGRIPAQFPDIGEIPGLQAALDGKADDSEVATINGRLTTAETAISGQGSRLTTAESNIGANTDAIGTNSASITSQGARITTLEGAYRSAGDDFELYGDVVSTVPRHAAIANVQLTSGTMLIARLRLRSSPSIRVLKVCVAGTLATGAGSVEAALYIGTVTSNLILSSTNGVPLITTAGVKSVAFGATPIDIPADYVHMALALKTSGFTTAPSFMCTAGSSASLLNEGTGVTVASKTGVINWPTSISLIDGTWSNANIKPWISLTA